MNIEQGKQEVLPIVGLVDFFFANREIQIAA